MPATSRKQANLMRAALHGADFPTAKKVRRSMSKDQLKDFSHMSEHGESHAYDWRSRQNLKQNRGR